VFGRFLVREFKNTTNIFLQKVHVENFSQKKRQKLRGQVFLDFLLFYRVFGCFSARQFKSTTKNALPKNRVENVKQKNRQKSKTDFFGFLFSHFWAFLGEGSSKTP
jgi:hypothetical protein